MEAIRRHRNTSARALAVAIRRKRYPAVGEAAAKAVLAEIRIDVDAGAFVAIVGPSGCGKTTLLNIVAGLDTDFEGRVDVAAEPHHRHDGAAPAAIGYVFQEPRLLPWKTVEQNLRLVLPGVANADARIAGVLRSVGLETARSVYPSRLSVGMARRAAIARAFVVEPALLLMDEPFVSIDGPTAARLRRLLLDMLAARPTTVLFVTHDLSEAVGLADRILCLSGTPARIVADVPMTVPRHERSAARIETLRKDLSTRLEAR